MKNKIKDYLGIAAIFSLVVFSVAGVVCVKAYYKSIPASSLRSFSVSGEGEAIGIPDVAKFSFSVITQGGLDVAVLQKENSEKTNKAIDFLKSNKIDAKDIKTQYYNLSPRYDYGADCSSGIFPCRRSDPKIIGYTVTQAVAVKVRDFSKTGEILSGVVENGANSVSDLSFEIDDPDLFQNKARAEAISKAKEEARAVAKAAGFRIGKLISIQEGYVPRPYYDSIVMAKGIGGGEASAAPAVEPGSQEIISSVTLIYEIR